MAVSAIAASGSPLAVPRASQAGPPQTTEQAATDAFGLSFESLLKIILTQLTYQDPLKPMDNFEFVSQLAQFSQIQQSQTMSERLQQVVSAQATVQATSLLGRTIDVAAGTVTVTGKVKAVSFQDGEPKITVETAQGQTVPGLPLTAVSQIREGS